jgi:transposase
MAEATHSGIEELARFARGLEDDLVAITAALILPWSNGVTEGQIHRLKLVKRQGYGRAGFALLRQRVVQAAYSSMHLKPSFWNGDKASSHQRAPE